MSIQTLTNYFLEYGAFFIFLIVLLEYLNLPGFPAGVIMPLSGIWASQGEISFPAIPAHKFPRQKILSPDSWQEEAEFYIRSVSALPVFRQLTLPQCPH